MKINIFKCTTCNIDSYHRDDAGADVTAQALFVDHVAKTGHHDGASLITREADAIDLRRLDGDGPIGDERLALLKAECERCVRENESRENWDFTPHDILALIKRLEESEQLLDDTMDDGTGRP